MTARVTKLEPGAVARRWSTRKPWWCSAACSAAASSRGGDCDSELRCRGGGEGRRIGGGYGRSCGFCGVADVDRGRTGADGEAVGVGFGVADAAEEGTGDEAEERREVGEAVERGGPQQRQAVRKSPA